MELRSVRRTLERIVEMDALGVLGLGNADVQARQFLALISKSVNLINLVHPRCRDRPGAKSVAGQARATCQARTLTPNGARARAGGTFRVFLG